MKNLKVFNFFKHETWRYNIQHYLFLFTGKKQESHNKNLLLKLVIENTNEIKFEQCGKTTAIYAGESRETSVVDIKLHV